MTYHYDCDRCGLHRDLQILPREYRLDDDRTVPMKQRHLWCAVCNDISVCESLVLDEAEQEYYEKRLKELRPLRDLPPADLSSLSRLQRVDAQFAAKWIQDIEQAMSDWGEWRSRRQAPSHCLRCDVPVEHVPEDGVDLSHVGCGGTLECTMTIGSSFGPAYVPHLYTVDGVLLKAGQKPNVASSSGQVDYFPMELFCSRSDS